MGAAAQLHRIGALSVQRLAQSEHAHAVAVFFAEKSDGARLDRRLRGHFAGVRGQILADHRIDLSFDRVELGGVKRRAVAEVEAHALGVDHLTLLGDVRAKHAAQSRVRQMGRGVVEPGARAPPRIHDQPRSIADRQAAAPDHHRVHMQVAGLTLGVENLAGAVLAIDLAAITGLPAALGVEWRGVEQDLDGLAALRDGDFLAVLDQGQDFANRLNAIVAGKHRRTQPIAQGQPHRALRLLARPRPAFPRQGALALHGFVEAGEVD